MWFAGSAAGFDIGLGFEIDVMPGVHSFRVWQKQGEDNAMATAGVWNSRCFCSLSLVEWRLCAEQAC